MTYVTKSTQSQDWNLLNTKCYETEIDFIDR